MREDFSARLWRRVFDGLTIKTIVDGGTVHCATEVSAGQWQEFFISGAEMGFFDNVDGLGNLQFSILYDHAGEPGVGRLGAGPLRTWTDPTHDDDLARAGWVEAQIAAGGGGVQKYVTTIAGNLGNHLVTHNLNTLDVQVYGYDTVTGYAVDLHVHHYSVNATTIYLTNGPTPNPLRIVVIG